MGLGLLGDILVLGVAIKVIDKSTERKHEKEKKENKEEHLFKW